MNVPGYTLYRSRTVRQLTKYTVARKGCDLDNKADMGQAVNHSTSRTSSVTHHYSSSFESNIKILVVFFDG